MMRALPFLLFAVAFSAAAQDREIQQQLIQRQQQSDAFNLQLRQSQEALKAAPAARPELETRQLGERQRLENLSTQQQIDVKTNTPPELRPYERQKAEDERRALTVPAKETPQRTGDEPRPLPAPSGGIVLPPGSVR
ncbi:MAG TPA: hypothetical protein VMU46_11770 [Burkholderiales bacterium]|nr:hypothetical protein [Burkholderiales bacterium]